LIGNCSFLKIVSQNGKIQSLKINPLNHNGMSTQKLTGEVYFPSDKTKKKANIKDRSILDLKAGKDYEGFWEG
jgi:hypothetical protein